MPAGRLERTSILTGLAGCAVHGPERRGSVPQPQLGVRVAVPPGAEQPPASAPLDDRRVEQRDVVEQGRAALPRSGKRTHRHASTRPARAVSGTHSSSPSCSRRNGYDAWTPGSSTPDVVGPAVAVASDGADDARRRPLVELLDEHRRDPVTAAGNGSAR